MKKLMIKMAAKMTKMIVHGARIVVISAVCTGFLSLRIGTESTERNPHVKLYKVSNIDAWKRMQRSENLFSSYF